MSDIRVAMDPFLDAFGLPAVVTRPAPNNTPITTSGFWIQPLAEQQPFGTDMRRYDPRRVFVLAKSAVPTAPKGTLIAAAEYAGGATKNWVVDGYERTETDDLRLIVVAAAA